MLAHLVVGEALGAVEVHDEDDAGTLEHDHLCGEGGWGNCNFFFRET